MEYYLNVQTMSNEMILIQDPIHEIRGKKVMLDFDLARLYQVETRALNQAVQRNLDRFPDDFMFKLENEDFKNLKSQIVISSWGGRRKMPLAFTEQGVAMLSGLLHSKVVLFLLQFCGGIGPGGAEGLPEDGEERDHQGDHGTDYEHPAVTLNPVVELPQVTLGEEYGDRNPD